MSDASYRSIQEENSLLFKRSIRRLYEATFILKEKDEALYDYVSKESNQRDISDYLKMIGWDILVDEKCRLAMLVASEEDEATVGLKRANVVTFTTFQYHLLLILWEIYLENLGYEEATFVSKGDLIDKIKAYGVLPSSADWKAVLKLFKKYSLIDYDENDTEEEARIRLYPSLQFGWDIPQFQVVANGYLNQNKSKEESESDSQESAEAAQEEEDE